MSTSGFPLGAGVFDAFEACGVAAPPAGDNPPLYEPQAVTVSARKAARMIVRIRLGYGANGVADVSRSILIS